MHNFEVVGQVGEGCFSQVFQVVRKVDGKTYALKKMKLAQLTAQERNNCLNEIRLLANIHHPHIIAYKEAFFEQDSLCLVMEYAANGDFLHFMMRRKRERNPLSEEEVCAHAREMLHGLSALHRTQVIHRDVKAANFFLGEDNTVKLGDMNVSAVSRNGMATTKIGTPYYTSPEIWQQLPYSYHSDIWAFGCLLYEMLTWQHPFTASDVAHLKQQVLTAPPHPLPPDCPPELRAIVDSCLQKDPSARPTAEQLLENAYLKRKYKEFKQKTMEKSLMNDRQHKMTCKRILREISGSNNHNTLPRSNYLSVNKQCSPPRRPSPPHRLLSAAQRSNRKKQINPRMLTMYNIYHQKPPGLPKITKPIMMR